MLPFDYHVQLRIKDKVRHKKQKKKLWKEGIAFYEKALEVSFEKKAHPRISFIECLILKKALQTQHPSEAKKINETKLQKENEPLYQELERHQHLLACFDDPRGAYYCISERDEELQSSEERHSCDSQEKYRRELGEDDLKLLKQQGWLLSEDIESEVLTFETILKGEEKVEELLACLKELNPNHFYVESTHIKKQAPDLSSELQNYDLMPEKDFHFIWMLSEQDFSFKLFLLHAQKLWEEASQFPQTTQMLPAQIMAIEESLDIGDNFDFLDSIHVIQQIQNHPHFEYFYKNFTEMERKHYDEVTNVLKSIEENGKFTPEEYYIIGYSITPKSAMELKVKLFLTKEPIDYENLLHQRFGKTLCAMRIPYIS